VGEALLWGIGSAGTLLIGAVIAFIRPPKATVLGLIMGFGAGVLLSAVAYELVAKAISTEGGLLWASLGSLPAASSS
jgi:ZIP family zinc transporter